MKIETQQQKMILALFLQCCIEKSNVLYFYQINTLEIIVMVKISSNFGFILFNEFIFLSNIF